MKNIILIVIILLGTTSLSAFEPIERISKPEELHRLQQTVKFMDLIKSLSENSHKLKIMN